MLDVSIHLAGDVGGKLFHLVWMVTGCASIKVVEWGSGFFCKLWIGHPGFHRKPAIRLSRWRRGGTGGLPCRTGFIPIAGGEHRGNQLRLAGATTMTIQRARHGFAMTDHMRNATDDFVSLAVLATGDSITITGMGNAVHHDPGVSIQDLTATGGLVAQANVITLAHCCFSFFIRSPAIMRWTLTASRPQQQGLQGDQEISPKETIHFLQEWF